MDYHRYSKVDLKKNLGYLLQSKMLQSYGTTNFLYKAIYVNDYNLINQSLLFLLRKYPDETKLLSLP